MTPAQTQEIDALIDRIAELLEQGKAVTFGALIARKNEGLYLIKHVDRASQPFALATHISAKGCAREFAYGLTPTRLRKAIEAAEGSA